MVGTQALELAAPRAAAPSAVVWLNASQAIVAAWTQDGLVTTCELGRGSLPQATYLAQVVHVIGDRQRVVILGPSTIRLALEREYVAVFQRPERLVDVEPAGLVSPEELERRLRPWPGTGDSGAAAMRVLVATDGSSSAGLALDLAAAITWPEGSQIRAVMVIDLGMAAIGGPWPAVGLVQVELVESELRRAADEVVEEARARLARPASRLTPTSCAATGVGDRRSREFIPRRRRRRGQPRRRNDRVDAPRIRVRGGRRPRERPVAVARGSSVNRAVLGWDGSSGARAAAALLEGWPILARTCVRVVSVADVEFPWWTGLPIDGSPELQPAYADAATASWRGTTRSSRGRWLTSFGGEAIEAEAECREGDAATELLAAARAWRADLIVMGTHGRTGLARLILGSVARNVLQHATCSVLIVREPERSQPRS